MPLVVGHGFSFSFCAPWTGIALQFWQGDGVVIPDAPLTFLMHWSFKTGYHEIAARKFLATGAPFPECQSWKRFHGPGSVEGWILVEAENADACYEHAAEWAECLDWEVTPVLPDEQAGPLMAKIYT